MPSPRNVATFFVLAAASMAAALPNPSAFDYDCPLPDVSVNPEDWSTKEFLKATLPNPMTPTPIFWSGVVKNGDSTRGYAEKCGATVAGATLGQIMCNYNKNVAPGKPKFVMPDDGAPAAGHELWDLGSHLFAEYTKGEAFVATGSMRVTGTWMGTEWPALKINPEVSIVTSIDPESCAKKCHWYCNTSKLPGCNGLQPCAVVLDG